MNSDETKNIKAIIILEVIGKPPEHLIETLENLIKQIDEEKGINVKKKEIKKPMPMEKKVGFLKSGGEEKAKQHKDFYTTFAEIEIEAEEIFNLAFLMFKYMPAHVEIISPELIALTNNGWNEIFNELTRRLHGYDEVARMLQVEKEILERKFKELIGDKEKSEETK